MSSTRNANIKKGSQYTGSNLKTATKQIIVPPIESELSVLTGTFLHNYDIRDINLKLSVIGSTVGKHEK